MSGAKLRPSILSQVLVEVSAAARGDAPADDTLLSLVGTAAGCSGAYGAMRC